MKLLILVSNVPKIILNSLHLFIFFLLYLLQMLQRVIVMRLDNEIVFCFVWSKQLNELDDWPLHMV